MPFSHTGGATSWHNIKTISDNVLSALKNIDELVEKRVGEGSVCRALRPFPRFSTIVSIERIVRDKLGYDVRVTVYDFIPVIISELGIVRSIRFSGDTSRLDSRSSFTLEKLKRCKGENARVADELHGSFITYGKIENTNLSSLQLYVGSLMGLIRPYAKILAKNVSAIIPSPLSLFAFKCYGSTEQVWLSPSTVTVHLSSNDVVTRKLYILGKRIEGVVTNGYFISCKPSIESLSFAQVGPFPIIFPLSRDFLDDVISTIDALKNHDIVAHLAGTFVFKGNPFLLSGSMSADQGYFLALSELPIPLDVEIISMIGEPWNIDLGGRYDKRIYPAIKGDVDFFNRVKGRFLREIYRLKTDYKAEDFLQNQTVGAFLLSLNTFFNKGEVFKYYLSPSLITITILDNIHAGSIYRSLYEVIRVLNIREKVSDWELISLIDRDEILKKIIREIGTHTRVWAEAYTMHEELAKKFNLGFVM
ncbi:MAG: hypothetical protein QXY49_03550 [Thermofilaceae archaeon]